MAAKKAQQQAGAVVIPAITFAQTYTKPTDSLDLHSSARCCESQALGRHWPRLSPASSFLGFAVKALQTTTKTRREVERPPGCREGDLYPKERK